MKSFLSFFSSKREEKPQRQTVFGANTENLIAKVVQEEEVKPKASPFSTAPTLATGDASKPKAPKPLQAPVSSSTPVSTDRASLRRKHHHPSIRNFHFPPADGGK